MSSLQDFRVFLDLKLNPGQERKDWIFVLDLASSHRAAEFRAKVPKHIHIVYIPAQSTSCCQPCDVAMFRTWKSVLAAAANESFAESVVDGQNIKTTFDFSLVHLKRRSVVLAEEATVHVQNRIDLRKSAWKHVSCESDEDFGRMVTQAQVMHDADQLFISHADQPVDAPAAGCDTIDEHTIFDLDKQEEPEEDDDEDESAAAPSSSSVWCTHQTKRTMDKFLALRNRLWQRTQGLSVLAGSALMACWTALTHQSLVFHLLSY